MKILYLEPFYGGSHRATADALVSNSRHEIDLATLPAHNWKWRVRGSALTLAERVQNPSQYSLIVTGGMITISDLRAQRAFRSIPLLLYAHETQLTYPTPDGNTDLHLAFTDIANMYCSTHTSFNSSTHREQFLEEARALIARMPRPRPRSVLPKIETNSSVCYPGIDESFFRTSDENSRGNGPPLILWNHRWEFDKNPSDFFSALRTIRERGVAFRLAVLGENFQVQPREFERARKEFAGELVAFGFVESRSEYQNWLSQADMVVSTAVQENFGLSVVEAVSAGCIPVLPDRLSYPELIPPELRSQLLYRDQNELCARLESAAKATTSGEPWVTEVRDKLTAAMAQFSWKHRIHAFDELFDRVAATAEAWD